MLEAVSAIPNWRASEASETLSSLFNRELRIYIIGERAKRARHSQVCSIENRGYIYIQVKKKAFKINAKIEDVGLNED